MSERENLHRIQRYNGMDALPLELIKHIFSMLPIRDLLVVGRANQKYYDLSRSDPVWQYRAESFFRCLLKSERQSGFYALFKKFWAAEFSHLSQDLKCSVMLMGESSRNEILKKIKDKIEREPEDQCVLFPLISQTSYWSLIDVLAQREVDQLFNQSIHDLLSNSSKLNLLSNQYGPLFSWSIVFQYPWNQIDPIMQQLNINFDDTDVTGRFALEYAAQFCKAKILQKILDAGASVGMPGSDLLLLIAVQSGCTEKVHILLDTGQYNSVDIKYEDEMLTPLMLAAQYGDEAMVTLLLNKGAPVDEVDAYGWSALMYAADQGDSGKVQVLFDKGASIHVTDAEGYHALGLAVISGLNATIIGILIEKGRMLNFDDIGTDGDNILELATRTCDAETIQILLDNGAATLINKANDYGRTALMFAASFGGEETVRTLLANGALVNACCVQGWSALMYAAQSGDSVIIQDLVNADADLDAANTLGLTALMIAAKHGHLPVVQILLDNHAAPNQIDTKGWTALMYAVDIGDLAIVQALLNKGALIHVPNSDVITAIHLAALENHTTIFQTLLNTGYLVDQYNVNWLLIYCARLGNAEMVKTLINAGHGVSVNFSDDISGDTVLMSAVRYGDMATVQVLLDNGAQVNTRNREGFTALMYAICFKDAATLKILLDNGASVSVADANGNTTLMYATQCGMRKTMNLIIDRIKQLPLEQQIQIMTQKSKENTDVLMVAIRSKTASVIPLLKYIGELPIDYQIKLTVSTIDQVFYSQYQWSLQGAPKEHGGLLTQALQNQNFSLADGVWRQLQSGSPDYRALVLQWVELHKNIQNQESFLTFKARIAAFPGGVKGFLFMSLLVVPLFILPLYWAYKNWSEQRGLKKIEEEIQEAQAQLRKDKPSFFRPLDSDAVTKKSSNLSEGAMPVSHGVIVR